MFVDLIIAEQQYFLASAKTALGDYLEKSGKALIFHISLPEQRR